MKELIETIKSRPQRNWEAHAEQYYMEMEKWFKEVLTPAVEKFQKDVVCIKRTWLKKRIAYYEDRGIGIIDIDNLKELLGDAP